MFQLLKAALINIFNLMDQMTIVIVNIVTTPRFPALLSILVPFSWLFWFYGTQPHCFGSVSVFS